MNELRPSDRTRPRAATLAVGTEVTDGQITDRNSAWISQKLVAAGVEMVEHRAVPDDRDAIASALNDLSHRVDLLFVTGGLGPTSDDFTRDLLSSVFEKPLEYDEASWQKIIETLKARGISAKEIQKQQCYFPHGSRILVNPAGTANAFSFEAKVENERRLLRVYALPGPPAEIAAIWSAHLNEEIEALLPVEEREELWLIRTMGRGESDIAEIVEEVIRGSGLKVGYRAHLPYIEVKLWRKVSEREKHAATFSKVESALATWLVNHNHEDATDLIVEKLKAGSAISIHDFATGGFLQERVIERLRSERLVDQDLPFMIETHFKERPVAPQGGIVITIRTKADNAFSLTVKLPSGDERVLEETLPFHYKIRSDRARKFMAEKALILLKHAL